MNKPTIPVVEVPDLTPVVRTITDIATVLWGPISLDILRDEAARAWWPRSARLRRKAHRLEADIADARERLEARNG